MYRAIRLTAAVVGTMALAACAVTPSSSDGALSDAPVQREAAEIVGASAHGGRGEAIDTTGYVRVPGGMLTHPSCTHRLPEGHSVGADRIMRDASGAAVKRLAPCAYAPVLTHEALHKLPVEERREHGGVVPATNGWLSYTWQVVPSNATTWNLVAARWKVPATPYDQSQTDFYFPGVEPGDFNVILQPVLQWGTSAAGGGNYWAMASWEVYGDGTAIYTDLTAVSTGDTIFGSIRMESASPYVSYWQVMVKDETTNQVRTGAFTSMGSSEWLFPEAFPAVHESYGDVDCENGVEFYDIHLYGNVNAATTSEIAVTYSPTTECVTTGSPSCFYCPSVSGTTTWVY